MPTNTNQKPGIIREFDSTRHFDRLEVRDPEQRELALFAALPHQIAHAKGNAPYFGRLFRDVDPTTVKNRHELAKLPLTHKRDLYELQRAMPPFGGLTAVDSGRLAKIFISPGPTYDPEGASADYWRIGRALFAAGFRSSDVVQNCFSYHLTPAGSMTEGGLRSIGCAVIPAGVGQTELQVQTIADLRPAGYVGTPSFLGLILDKAQELERDVSSIRKALVSGEAFPAALREAFNARGIAAFQGYVTADIGMIAYETEARDGLVVDEGVIVEIVHPGSGDPVADGEVGEVVVTTFNRDYPLIRFATGDLSAALPGQSECGRTNMRINGWMGRADQTTKVRGMFVHPHQIAEIVKRFPEIQRTRVVVDRLDGADRMRLLCVVSAADDGLRDRIEASVREIARVRGDVEFVDAHSLPNDGKVIEDMRKID